MAVWSVIDFPTLKDVARWDPEYFQPSNLEMEYLLRKHEPRRIGDFADVTDGIHASPEWVDEGIPYLSAKSIKEFLVDVKGAGQISHSQDNANPRTRAQAGDVLLTSVGTIGNAGVVEPDALPANMDRHLGIIRIHDVNEVDPYYLAAFLNCAYGRFQSIREATGNVQPNLFIQHIRSLLVPTQPHIQKAGAIVRSALEELRRSEDLYPEAEAELLERLGWDELDAAPKELFYTENFAELTDARRYDPEFFQPQYPRLRQRIRELGSKTVGELCYFIKHGLQPEYVEGGDVGIISQRQFRLGGLDLDLLENFTSADFTEKNPDFLLRAEDVLTYSVSAGEYLGRTWLFEPERVDVDCVAASFVTILRTEQLVPGYLALFLNSPAGTLQSNQLKRGTSPFYLYPRDISNVDVYVPRNRDGSIDVAWQKALADKMQQAGTAKAKAREKLDEAKRLIEDALTP